MNHRKHVHDKDYLMSKDLFFVPKGKKEKKDKVKEDIRKGLLAFKGTIKKLPDMKVNKTRVERVKVKAQEYAPFYHLD